MILPRPIFGASWIVGHWPAIKPALNTCRVFSSTQWNGYQQYRVHPQYTRTCLSTASPTFRENSGPSLQFDTQYRYITNKAHCTTSANSIMYLSLSWINTNVCSSSYSQIVIKVANLMLRAGRQTKFTNIFGECSLTFYWCLKYYQSEPNIRFIACISKWYPLFNIPRIIICARFYFAGMVFDEVSFFEYVIYSYMAYTAGDLAVNSWITCSDEPTFLNWCYQSGTCLIWGRWHTEYNVTTFVTSQTLMEWDDFFHPPQITLTDCILNTCCHKNGANEICQASSKWIKNFAASIPVHVPNIISVGKVYISLRTHFTIGYRSRPCNGHGIASYGSPREVGLGYIQDIQATHVNDWLTGSGFTSLSDNVLSVPSMLVQPYRNRNSHS